MTIGEQPWLFMGRDAELARCVKRTAGRLGADCLWTKDPDEALDTMLVERPGLVVMEDSPPHGGGGLQGLLLASKQCKVAAIVVTEGAGPLHVRWTSSPIGGEVVIQRPVDADEFLHLALEQLRGSREDMDSNARHWSRLQPLSFSSTPSIPRASALLERAERMATRAVLADGVVHRLSGLFFLLPGHLDLLEADLECLRTAGDPRGDAALNRLRLIQGHLERAAGAMRNWRFPPLSSASTTVDLISVAREALSLLRPELERRARLTGTLEGRVWVEGRRERLQELVINLAVNAIQAVGEGAVDRPEVGISCVIDGADALLTVTDTGPGVPADLADRIFTPFFTTKPQEIGTGLGLSICRAIAREHGGMLELDPTYTGGARFTVRLPCSSARPVRSSEGKGGNLAQRVRARVLVVDDEPAIRRALRYILREQEVVEAGSVGEAKEVIGRDAAFDLILCDVMMPGTLGTALHGWLGMRYPVLLSRLVFMTGGVHDQGARSYLESHALEVIEKPELLTWPCCQVAGSAPSTA